jgi:HEAT repeat protein
MGLFDFLKRSQKASAPVGGLEFVVQELVARPDDEDPLVRRDACRRLAALGHDAAPAVERLQELIHDEDGEVCLAAAAALSEIER